MIKIITEHNKTMASQATRGIFLLKNQLINKLLNKFHFIFSSYTLLTLHSIPVKVFEYF